MTRALRGAHPELPIVWGGWHPSLFPLECLEEPGVVASVIGQGEDTFSDLVERFADGRPLDDVPGCAFRPTKTPRRLDTGPKSGPKRVMRELRELPAHDYSLIDVEAYFKAKGRRQLDYISSQGCRFRCSFCADPQVYERGWTAIPAPRMGEELEELSKRYRFDDLNLQDETYFTHRERVGDVSEEILRRGLSFTWAATMRADQGSRLSDREWAHCKRSGLRRVMVGVESGSQAMMDWLKKDITVDEVFMTAERMVRHRVAGIFPFIVGFPDETDESIDATIDVIKRLRRMSPEFEVSVYFYQPYPGSPIADLAWQRGYAKPARLSEWASFDYVGSRGPWVTREKWERVQRFKFYQHHAYGRRRWAALPLRLLARARLRAGFLGAPIEKLLVEAFHVSDALS